MCSWCWGYRPVWDALQQALPASVVVQYVAGGLAPDTDVPMPMAQQKIIQGHWRNIQQTLATEFNFDFWLNNTPYRSTYPACRALIAAAQQGFQLQLLDAIQRAYYLRALNPSKNAVLVQLVEELYQSNNQSLVIDVEQFKIALQSSDTKNELQNSIQLSIALTQQGFPSLVFEQNGQRSSITLHYQNYKVSFDEIKRLMG